MTTNSNMDDFEKARWVLIKNCEMCAKRTLNPELQKMAKSIWINRSRVAVYI